MIMMSPNTATFAGDTLKTSKLVAVGGEQIF
jgi:hypothetical protein